MHRPESNLQSCFLGCAVPPPAPRRRAVTSRVTYDRAGRAADFNFKNDTFDVSRRVTLFGCGARRRRPFVSWVVYELPISIMTCHSEERDHHLFSDASTSFYFSGQPRERKDRLSRLSFGFETLRSRGMKTWKAVKTKKRSMRVINARTTKGVGLAAVPLAVASCYTTL
ncbi:hypothetical protein EVAR_69150_1 [Eumeta japonica]|uniref:Uncharacterized protein n=1 Tax=Eumeta variegata TaxID=151549 RepID=A0A4C1SQM2_EUMVA|nr:hypothetical protein EVAR_69150_1 [Eumeta japonica]